MNEKMKLNERCAPCAAHTITHHPTTRIIDAGIDRIQSFSFVCFTNSCSLFSFSFVFENVSLSSGNVGALKFFGFIFMTQLSVRRVLLLSGIFIFLFFKVSGRFSHSYISMWTIAHWPIKNASTSIHRVKEKKETINNQMT